MAHRDDQQVKRPPVHSKWKRRAMIALFALVLIGIPIAFVWTIIDIQRCYDRGGVYVAPFMRGQHCAEAEPTKEALTGMTGKRLSYRRLIGAALLLRAGTLLR